MAVKLVNEFYNWEQLLGTAAAVAERFLQLKTALVTVFNCPFAQTRKTTRRHIILWIINRRTWVLQTLERTINRTANTVS